jgi:hypothetical protein
MAVDPPYRLDPLQNIVNVFWGEVSDVGASLWKYLPGTIVVDPGTHVLDGWILVVKDAAGVTGAAYIAAKLALVTAGYADMGTVFERTATGLVVDVAPLLRNSLFLSFDDVADAAADDHVEEPWDSECFRLKHDRVEELVPSLKAFATTFHVLSSDST